MSSCLTIVVAYKLMFSTYAEHFDINKPLIELLLALSHEKHENMSMSPGSLYLYVDEKQKFKLF